MDNFLLGLTAIIDPSILFLLFSGVLIGLVVGSIPGLTTNMAIAVMVPFTFTMEPVGALVFLVAIYCSGMMGGSIAAILLGIPGTGAAAATTFDGYPMAQKGEAAKAIYVGTMSSVIGGLISTVVLILFAPLLANQAVKFGPGEYFALGIFGISTVASMSESKSLIRGLISGLFGLLIATFGMSPLTGFSRFTFGRVELMDGFPLVPVLIGLFGMGSILSFAAKNKNSTETVQIKNIGKLWYPFSTLNGLWRTILSSSIIGNLLGIIPGPGAVAASFMAYDRAKRTSKTPEKFGTGFPEGVAATEAANNAVVGGSLVPLLALGVPGNSVSALFLGALLIHGVRVGPALFKNTPEIAYGLLVSMFLANLLMAPLGFAVGRLFAYFLKIPVAIMNSIVLALCTVGTYALRNNVGDMVIMIMFGLISFLMKKTDLPQSPLILGLILGPMIELSLHQAWSVFDGDMSFLVTRPISLVLMLLAIYSISSAIIKNIRTAKLFKNFN